MSEMKERVENAISEACDYALPPFLLERCARAAIEAMREPTEDMKAVEGVHWGYYCHVCGGLTEGWHAMIDAALGKVDA